MGKKRKNKEEAMIENQNEQENVVEILEQPIEEVNEIAEEKIEEVKEVTGRIIAEQLYVRTGPSREFDHSAILEKGTLLNIDLEYDDKDFYKVVTSDGIEGYCMKDFIEIV